MPVKNYHTMNRELIGETDANGVRTDYLTDALGNVIATMNQSAQIINPYHDKPYGSLLAKTGTGADPSFRWVGAPGYRQMGNTFADVYVRNRTYDTTTGRWTTKDPVLSSPNAYSYVDARPTNLSDPFGLLPWMPSQGRVTDSIKSPRLQPSLPSRGP